MVVFVVVAETLIDGKNKIRVTVFDSYDLALECQEMLYELSWQMVRIDTMEVITK